MRKWCFYGLFVLFLIACVMTACEGNALESAEPTPTSALIPTKEPALTPVETTCDLTVSVQYVEIAVKDSIQLEYENGRGWSIDLNGDGVAENLYIDENGLYLNCQLVLKDSYAYTLHSDMELEVPAFWLLDIDTEDSFIEILTAHGTPLDYVMYYYSEDKEFVQMNQGEMIAYWMTAYTPYENAEDIRKPVRIDAHTVEYLNFFSIFEPLFLTASYCLDENHNLVLAEEEYELSGNDRLTYSNENVPVRLYKERTLESEYCEVMGNVEFLLTKSDLKSWFYFESEKGSGWFYAGRDENGELMYLPDSFEGFNTAP